LGFVLKEDIMESNCHYEKEKFIPCEDFDILSVVSWEVKSGDVITREAYCKACGTKITEEDKTPSCRVMRSGNTWVATYEGKDYIYTGRMKGEPKLIIYNDGDECVQSYWKEIPPDFEITDEIAILSPIGIWYPDGFNPNEVQILRVIKDTFPIVCYNIRSHEVDGYRVKEVRLATVKDLMKETK